MSLHTLLTTKISIPKNIQASYDSLSNTLTLIKDKKKKNILLSKNISIIIDSNFIFLEINAQKNVKKNFYKKYLNTNIAIIKQNLKGLKQPFKLKLKLIGIGFKYNLYKEKLALKIGYSHICYIDIPNNISINLINATTIVCSCINWDELTNFVAKIKSIKTTDPYKIKGIFLEHDYINLRKKEGKKNKK